MPYIDNTDLASPYKVYATDMLGGILNILVSNGWVVTKSFRKAIVRFGNPTAGVYDRVVGYDIARHTIVRSPHGKHIGFAELGSVQTNKLTPDIVGTFENDVTVDMLEQVNTSLKNVPFEATEKNFHMYMLENEPTYPNDSVTLMRESVWQSNGTMHFKRHVSAAPLSADIVRGLVDVEYSAIRTSNVIVEGDEITSLYRADVRQSPTVVVDYFRNLGKVDETFNTSNLWGDTEFSVQGRVDGDGFFFAIQGDLAVAPTNNVMASYPILYSEIIDGDGRQVSDCLFAGSMPSSATFDFSDATKLATGSVMPIAKSYPRSPSDGVNSVMVKRGRRGARYQAHYLSWGATPATMPPNRTNGGKQYPRAWSSAVQNYGFQPSGYSNKVQTSHIYVVHPEEGSIGRLKNIVGLQILTTSNPELRILREACPVKVRETFKTTQISAVSPFTKRPATVYPVMSLAVRKSVAEKVPSTVPAAVTGLAKTTANGKTTLTWDAVNDPFVEHLNIYKDGTLVMPNVSDVNKVIVEGSGTFGVELVDFAGKKSTLTTV